MSSISVIIPALNEEQNLRPTVEKILSVLPQYFEHFELLIYDDGSEDKTTEIGIDLAKHESIKFTRHDISKNLGYIYQDGIKNASCEYVIMIHGQNDIKIESLNSIFQNKDSDLVIPFQKNTFERPLSRALISRLFVLINNLIFGLRLKYYNHYVLCRKSLLESIEITSFSYAFQAEVLVKLIKQGVEFKEVGIYDDFSNKVESKAFRVRNIIGVMKFYISIIHYLYIKRKKGECCE